MKRLIFLAITIALLTGNAVADTNTTSIKQGLKIWDKESLQKIDWRQILEKQGIKRLAPSEDILKSISPDKIASDSGLIKLRQKFNQQIESNKLKKKPDIFIPPNSVKAKKDVEATPKKKSQTQFQGKIETLPNNLRMVAEFEEMQAVLVSIPTYMFCVLNGQYVQLTFTYDFDSYMQEVYTDLGLVKDSNYSIPPGWAVYWPYQHNTSDDPLEVYYFGPDKIINIPELGVFQNSTGGLDHTMGDLWGKLIYNIQQAGATAWIRFSGMGQGGEFDTNYVKQYLASRGYPLTNYKFVSNGLEDSFWCRDWGPFGVYYDDSEGNKKLGFLDAQYYTGRKFDDEFNSYLYDKFGYDYYNLDVKMEGGNIMNDGMEYGIYGDVIYPANSAGAGSLGQYYWNEEDTSWYVAQRTPLTNVELDQRMRESFNFEEIVMESLEYDGGTGHIDLWNKQFDEETILIAFGPETPEKYEVLADYKTVQRNREKYNSLKTAFGTNYRLLNAPMPRLDNSDMPTIDANYDKDPRGYLNGVTVNNYYIYPSFSEPGEDNWKLDSTNNEILKKLLPGYVLVPIDSRLLTTGGGAIHCITMQIPKDPDKTITLRHKPIRDITALASSFELSATLEWNPNDTAKKVSIFWKKQNETEFTEIEMTATDAVWNGNITGDFTETDTINYYIAAKGSTETVIKTAPITAIGEGYKNNGYYTFWFKNVFIDELYNYSPTASVITSIYPNPASDYINVIFENIKNGNVRIDILNTMGEVLQTPINQNFSQGVFTFDVRNLNLAAGAYLIKMTTDSGVSTSNFIIR